MLFSILFVSFLSLFFFLISRSVMKCDVQTATKTFTKIWQITKQLDFAGSLKTLTLILLFRQAILKQQIKKLAKSANIAFFSSHLFILFVLASFPFLLLRQWHSWP